MAGSLLQLGPGPSAAWRKEVGVSSSCADFLWNGLDHGSRMVYTTARSSWEYFCINTGVKPYPAQERPLGEWIAARANGAAIALGNGPLKATTIETYLSHIRSVHVDLRLNTEVFSSSFLKRIIKGVRRCQPTTVKQTGALTALQVQKMTVPSSSASDIDNVNLNAAAKVAFSGFLRSGEFTYSKADLGRDSFQSTNLTRADVTFANDDKYAILRLKRSKTDHQHRGVDIHLASSKGPLCPVVALRKLFTDDPQPPSSPLFRMEKKIFSRTALISSINQRLHTGASFSGHSFRRGAAQHAKDNGICDDDIQSLGRWSSEAFRLYFNTSQKQRFALSYRFQTHTAPPI